MTFANQTRILTNNIKDLLTYIGQGFIAAIRPAVVVLNLLMTKLIQAAKAFRTFMYTLTGYKGAGSQGGIVDDLAGVGDMYDDISGIGGAGNDAADGLSNASGAANDLKKSLSVLPFDQLNQLAAAAENTASGLGDVSSDVGSIGSVGDLGLGDIETGVMDLDSSALVEEINEWAEDIRNAFINKKWNTLGFVIANGINEGLDYLYSVISWDNVGPRITSFIHDFSTTFNSLVDWLDWDRMGRIVGAGINTITNSLNLLLTGIDWKDLGLGFSTNLMGLVDEVDWGALGDLVGNGLNAVTKTLYGYFTGLNPEVLGAEAARFVKHAFKRIDWDSLSKMVTTGFNTVIQTLMSFIDEHPFEGVALKLASFLNDTITGVDWHNAGATIGNLFKNSLKGISKFIQETDFEELGRQVGLLIQGMDWNGILRNVGRVVWDAIMAALKFFKGTFSAAPVETQIVTVLSLLKFTGLGSKLGSALWNKISEVVLAPALTAFFGSKVTKTVKGAVEDSVEKGISGSDLSKSSGLLKTLITSQFGMLAGAITLPPLLGVIMAQWTEVLKGGNGIMSEFGGGVQSLIQKLSESNSTISQNAQELFLLSESYELNETNVNEWANGMIEAFKKSNVTFDEASRALNLLYSNGNITEDTFKTLSNAILVLGNETATMSEKVSLAGIDTESAYSTMEEAIRKVAGASADTSGVLTGLTTVLYAQQDAGANAQVAFDAIILAMESMGLETTGFIEILKKEYPEAFEVVEKSTETSMTNAEKSVETHMKNASSSASSSSSKMVKDVTGDLEKIEKQADDSFGGVSDTSDSDWTASQTSVEDALKLMQSASSEKMRAIYKNVESYTNSIYNITTNNWSVLSLRVSQLMDEMNVSIGEKLESTKSLFTNFGNEVAGSMNLYSAGRSAAQTFANGFRSVYVPTPHMRIASWRQHNLPNGGMMQSPVFEVNWYKDGGIFGNASVIGVGEAGREAVLPLENRRSMRMIADSIVSSAGSGFMDESTMINAVAAGVSMAMSGMSFGDTPQNDVVIMIDGREVARAVNRANERTGYRNNP